jgi:hypothetical protein
VATRDSAQSISSQSGSGDHTGTDRTVASAAAGHISNTRPAPLQMRTYIDNKKFHHPTVNLYSLATC